MCNRKFLEGAVVGGGRGYWMDWKSQIVTIHEMWLFTVTVCTWVALDQCLHCTNQVQRHSIYNVAVTQNLP